VKKLNIFTSLLDKTSSLGAFVSLLGCTVCFPAVASLGAAIGMGFLSQWEGLLLGTLLPIFAWLALTVNGLGWLLHHQWFRSLLGMIGPIILLLSLYPWFKYAWSSYATYTGIAIMLIVSIWDLFSPANKHCGIDNCDADSCDIK